MALLGDAVIEVGADFSKFQEQAARRAKAQFARLQSQWTREAIKAGEGAGSSAAARFSSVVDRGFRGAAGIMRSALTGLGTAAAIGGSALAAVGVAGVTAGVKTAASMQNAEIAFTTMLQSGERADAFLQQLSAFAAKTPFEFPELQTAASSLISAGIEADKVIPIMTSLGNATSGMGTGSEGVQRATVALQQMSAAGRITGEDLNQLRDAGIPVFDLLAAATGKSKEEVAALAQAGKLGAAELAQLMNALETGKGLERFNGLMEKQSASLGGAWSTLSDTINMGLANAMQPAIPILTNVTNSAAELAARAAPAIAGFFERVISMGPNLAGAVQSWDVQGIAEVLDNMLGNTGMFVGPIRAIITAGQDIANIIQSGVLPAFSAMTGVLPTVGTMLQLIQSTLSFLSDNTWLVTAGIIAIVTAMTAWKVGTIAVNSVLTVQNALVAVQAAGGLKKFLLATNAVKAAQLVWTGVQWALNAAMSANPIAIVVLAIAGLVAAIVLAWQNSETFRNVVLGAWDGIKAGVGAVVNWFTSTVWPALQSVWDAVSSGVQWLWTNGIKPALDAIVAGWNALGGWLNEAWVGIIKPIFDGVQLVVTTVASWVVDRFNDVVLGWQILGQQLTAFYDSWIKPVFDLFGAIATWLWDSVLKPFLGSVASGWVDLAKQVANVYATGFKLTIEALGAIFRWLWDNVVKPVIGWVQDAWTGWGILLDTVWTGVLRPAINAVGAAFTWLWENAVKPAIDSIRNLWDSAIQAVVGVWTGTLSPALTAIGVGFKSLWENGVKPRLDSIRSLFESVGGGIKSVWETVVKVALDALGTAVGGLKGVFETAVSGIGTAWDRIKEIAKAPVKFVIETVLNNGIIEGFNKLARTFGTKELPKISLPKGFEVGGYTGRKPRKAVAGVVHGDEFVVRSAARRRFERSNPGALHHLNRFGEMPGYAGGGVVMPVPQRFGRWGSYPGHTGLDAPSPTGTPVRAFQEGVVNAVRRLAYSYGHHVRVGHGGGLESIYAHLSRITATQGQQLTAGQILGYSGSTGNSTGPHVHFETRLGGRAVNPWPYLNGAKSVAGGGADTGGGFDPIAMIADVVKGPLDKLKQLADTPMSQLARAVPMKIAETLKEKALGWITGGAKALAKGAGAAAWTPVLTTALAMNGLPISQLDNWLRQVASESGGNPLAQNNWDINAKNGVPSKGLLQVIPPTFAAYRSKLLPNNIFDPLANAYAAMNYAKNRYPNIEAVIGHGHGYDNGGWMMPGITTAINASRKPEPVLTSRQWQTMQRIAASAPSPLERRRSTVASSDGDGGLYVDGDLNITVSLEDLAQLEELADFIEMVKRSRGRGRRTARSGTVTA